VEDRVLVIILKNNFRNFTHSSETTTITKDSKCYSTSGANNKESVSPLNIGISKDNLGKKTLFFDFQSTTPMDPRVLDAMLPYMTLRFGNPHSKSHEYGWEAEK